MKTLMFLIFIMVVVIFVLCLMFFVDEISIVLDETFDCYLFGYYYPKEIINKRKTVKKKQYVKQKIPP